MFDGCYARRRVFVTGHTGFKGAWLTAWLLDLGAEVTGFSLDVPTVPAAFTELGLERRIRHLRGDVRDREVLARAMAGARPEVVFHLAAQPLVRASYEDPGLTFETNALGTLNLLEAVRRTPGIRAVVCITSDKCYRNDEWVFGYRETDPLGGRDPYSASKACAELVARAYFSSFFLNGPPMATARAGNVIGGGDWARDRIIPDCARAWAEGAPALIRNPGATRPWQHVLEPLSGYLWLGALLLRNPAARPDGPGTLPGLKADKEAFNFGPATEVTATVAEVTSALGAYWPGFRTRQDQAGETEQKESILLRLCCDKALALLGWRATLDFAETLRLTAEWYRIYYAENGADMRAVTSGQIAGYAAAAAAKDLPWAG